MKNSITLLLLLCSFIGLVPAADAADYFWVGNGGLWSDITHWSTVSGSTLEADRAPALPGPDDNVFFDANSFDTDNQVVQLAAGDNNCYNMSWTGVTNNPTLRFPNAAANLNIYYKIDLDDNMSVDFSFAPALAQINMLNTGVDDTKFIAAVATRGKTLPNIHFAGAGGVWSITNTLNVNGELRVSDGLLQSGSPSATTFDVNTSEFIVNGSSAELYLDRMNITASTRFSVLDVSSIRATSKSNGVDYVSTINTPLFEVSTANANTFGNLNITGSNGVLSASGQSIEFLGNVSLNGTATNTVLGDHTFSGDLILNVPGAINQLEAGATQTFGNQSRIVATGANCDNYFFLKSTVDGSKAIISKSGGPAINLTRFYFQDIHAVQTNKFNASLSIDLGNNMNLNFPAGDPTSLNYYWVGDSGNWSNGDHWMLEGGSTGCLPTANDNVFFDENSFSSIGQTVTVDLPNIYFNNMTWTATENPTWSIPSADIYVGGSLSLNTTMSVSVADKTNTVFHFTSESAGNTVAAGISGTTGHDLANVVFEGTGGGWNLGGSLIISGEVSIKDGTFNTSGNRLEAETFSVDGATAAVTLDEELFAKTFEIKAIGTLQPTGSNIYTTIFDITPSGLAFDELILQDSDDMPAVTEGTLKGDNLTFVDVNLNNSVKSTVLGSHTYSNLLQFSKQGMIAEFEAGTTHEMGDLEALGTECGGEIFLRSTLSGSQVNFVSTALLPISVSNLLIKDNAASPVASFIANDSQDLGNNSGWSFLSVGIGDPDDFFWIGGDGNWNDGANWSNVTGGDPINCIPTPEDNVFFDANSFDGADQVVTLDGPEQYCRNMVWDGVTGLPTMKLPAGNSLNVYGSLSLLVGTGGMSIDFEDGDDAAINFKATSTGFSIRTSGHIIPNLNFDGPGGGWSVNGAIEVGSSINLLNGQLNTNGNDLTVKQFVINGTDAALLLGSSGLEVPDKFDITQIDPANFDAGTSTIMTNLLESDVEGIAFNQVNLINNLDDFDNSPALNGNNLIFNSLVIQGTFDNYVYGSHQYNTGITFDNPTNAATTYFGAGSTQTLNGDAGLFFSATDSNKPAFIYSTVTGSTAAFSKTSGQVCVTFVRITDIAATGGAQFGYDQTSASAPVALGWIETADCESFLPVECTDFAAAVRQDNSVELYWTTAQEVNNSGFEVQRSLDGRRFETIAWIDGTGTTAEAQKYAYTDRRTEGLTEAYYRLRQVDFDGTAAFACEVQAVNFRQTGSGPLQLFPNPAGAQVQVRWFGRKNGTTIIRLFDQSGRLVLDREWSTLEGNNQRALPTTDLPAGIYELQVVDEYGRTEAARLVKE